MTWSDSKTQAAQRIQIQWFRVPKSLSALKARLQSLLELPDPDTITIEAGHTKAALHKLLSTSFPFSRKPATSR
jgi:hypothetical protein